MDPLNPIPTPMEQFTNHTLDLRSLPRYEDVEMTRPDSKYIYVVVWNLSIVFLVVLALLIIGYQTIEDVEGIVVPVMAGYIGMVLISSTLSVIAFRRKAFAFREHDLMFRSGVIASNTMIIPYNRVQHVSLHEGFIARRLGLARLEVFTAGGSSGDINIPGLRLQQAKDIRELLAGKIQKPL